jgi:hypothetical protein
VAQATAQGSEHHEPKPWAFLSLDDGPTRPGFGPAGPGWLTALGRARHITIYNTNQSVAYCLVDVIWRVGGCRVDGSIWWFGNIPRDDARFSKLSSAKRESNERVKTRDCHFLNETLRMKLLEGGGRSDAPLIRIVIMTWSTETLCILRAIPLRKRHSSPENHGDTACRNLL